MNSLEHKIPPPIMAFLTGAAMWGFTFVTPASAIDPAVRFGAIGLFSAIAIGVAGSGMLAFARAKTTINPTRPELASSIVDRGVFAYTRNPMYVGLTSMLIAWAAVLSSPWSLAGPLAFAVFTHRFQIIPEERILLEKFGREYQDYQRRVRRWL